MAPHGLLGAMVQVPWPQAQAQDSCPVLTYHRLPHSDSYVEVSSCPPAARVVQQQAAALIMEQLLHSTWEGFFGAKVRGRAHYTRPGGARGCSCAAWHADAWVERARDCWRSGARIYVLVPAHTLLFTLPLICSHRLCLCRSS
jgi:hypothetical protein